MLIMFLLLTLYRNEWTRGYCIRAMFANAFDRFSFSADDILSAFTYVRFTLHGEFYCHRICI